MKAALYCRVSTDIQVEGYSIEAQKKLLEAYCVSKEIKEFEYYIDGGFTGSNLDRPQMQRMLKDIKEEKVDCVIVYKLDRISRSQRDTLFLIEEIFNPRSIGFISIRENFDTTTPYGKAMIGVLSIFAQLERETIYERTRIGMKERVKSGLWMGGGLRPLGYDYDKNTGTLVIKEKQAQTIRYIFKLYLEGMSTEEINDALGMSGESIVRKILDSQVYIGNIFYKGKIYKGKHEPIISEEMFLEVQNMKAKRSNNNLKKSTYLLSGLVYCGKCGAKYRYQKWGVDTIKVYCYSQQKSRPKLVKDPNCNNVKVNATDLEAHVLKELFKLSLDDKFFESKMTSNMEDADSVIEKRLKDINDQITNIVLVISQGLLVEQLKEKIVGLENEKNKLEKMLNNKKKKQSNLKQFREKIQNLKDVWDSMSKEEQRNILITLINKIVINDNEIMIHYNIVI